MSQPATGAKTYGPPYKDPDLPLDEFCPCTKRLWSLTEYNVQKHLFGEKPGGGCPDYKKRRFEIQQGQDPNKNKKKQLQLTLFDKVRLLSLDLHTPAMVNWIDWIDRINWTDWILLSCRHLEHLLRLRARHRHLPRSLRSLDMSVRSLLSFLPTINHRPGTESFVFCCVQTSGRNVKVPLAIQIRALKSSMTKMKRR